MNSGSPAFKHIFLDLVLLKLNKKDLSSPGPQEVWSPGPQDVWSPGRLESRATQVRQLPSGPVRFADLLLKVKVIVKVQGGQV